MGCSKNGFDMEATERRVVSEHYFVPATNQGRPDPDRELLTKLDMSGRSRIPLVLDECGNHGLNPRCFINYASAYA